MSGAKKPISRGFAVGGEFGGKGLGKGRCPASMKHCICPECGEKELQIAGIPCATRLCPKCGRKMTRCA